MKACFMGLGYIGLPTAIIAAKHGVDVIGVDINPNVVEMTNEGKLHIVEPGLESFLQDVIHTKKLKAQGEPELSDAYFIVVPTPFKGNHEPDISYVETATHSVIPYLKENDLFIIESTSPRLILSPKGWTRLGGGSSRYMLSQLWCSIPWHSRISYPTDWYLMPKATRCPNV